VLDALPLDSAVSAIQQIGKADVHGREFRKLSSEGPDPIRERRAGLKILQSWPRGFYDLLDRMVAQRGAAKKRSLGGMSGMYGDLFKWLSDSSYAELDVFRGAMKRHAERRVTATTTSSAFGTTLETRTVTLSTVINHCGGGSSRKIHRLATHLGYMDANKPFLRSHPIPREGIDKIRGMIEDEISINDAVIYLNTNWPILKQLLDRSIINFASVQFRGKVTKILFRSTLDDFLARLFGSSCEIETVPEGVSTIGKATRKAAVETSDIIST
jgi:hypothetical protein